MDGELSDREADEMRERVARDPEAKALLAELRNTHAALAGHEEGIKLPESREFFWSKIQREIQRAEQPAAAQEPKVSWMEWLLRHWLPAGGVAVLSCLLVVLLAVNTGGSPAQLAEMELNSDDMGAYTFRDQQEKMTIIWLYDRSDSQFTPAGEADNKTPG